MSELAKIGEIVDRLADKVQRHMNWDTGEVLAWFRSPNPNLGGLSPFDMIVRDRHEKLERWIDCAIEESSPPKLETSRPV